MLPLLGDALCLCSSGVGRLLAGADGEKIRHDGARINACCGSCIAKKELSLASLSLLLVYLPLL